MKIEDQIKSPQWQKKRLEVLQRDNFQCQICGSTEKTLHVHHLYYKDNLNYWEYPDIAYITLCEDCHNREHKVRDSINQIVRHFNKCGITNTEIYEFLEIVYEYLCCSKRQDQVMYNMLHFYREDDSVFNKKLPLNYDDFNSIWFSIEDFGRLAQRRKKLYDENKL